MALQSSVFELSIKKSIDITIDFFFSLMNLFMRFVLSSDTSQIIDSRLSNVRLLL
jgi:hypothetical protein